MRVLMLAVVATLIAAPALGQQHESESLSTPDEGTAPIAETSGTTGPINPAALNWTDRDWRVNVRDLLGEQAAAEGTAKHELTRELLKLYNSIEQVELASRDQRVLASKLENRLLRARQEILVAQEEAEKQQPANVNARPGGGQLANNGVMAQVGQFMGQQFNQFAGGGNRNPVDDEGAELVELIEKTIDPDSWEINGGNGTIVYFGNLRVLVVRNTRDVHGQLQDLGDALRKVGN